MTRVKQLILAGIVLPLVQVEARAQIEVSRHFSEETQRGVMEAIVRITIQRQDGKAVQGSGVCIEYDGKYSYILSCAHVVEHVSPSNKTTVEFFTRQSYPNPSRVYSGPIRFWGQRNTDLGLIKLAARPPRTLKLCPDETTPPFRTPVLCVGCGIRAAPVCQVATFVSQDEKYDFLVNRGAIGGRSGGAVVSRHGLIGILARTGNDATVAVNHWKIHEFIAAVKEEVQKETVQAAPSRITWKGSETLQGFGKLTFQLHADGTAVMIDAKNTVKGNWNQKGQRVAIVFSNCAYAGELKGRTLRGTARFMENNESTREPWRFQVVRQK